MLNEENSTLLTEDFLIMLDNPQKTLRILIADDDQANLLISKDYLSKAEDYKFLLDTAYDGQQVLDMINSNKEKGVFYDLFVIDCNHPLMDGFGVSEKIKMFERTNLIPYTPIIALAAKIGTDERKKFECYGIEFFLSKPYQRQHFIKQIRIAYQQQQQTRRK